MAEAALERRPWACEPANPLHWTHIWCPQTHILLHFPVWRRRRVDLVVEELAPGCGGRPIQRPNVVDLSKMPFGVIERRLESANTYFQGTWRWNIAVDGRSILSTEFHMYAWNSRWRLPRGQVKCCHRMYYVYIDSDKFRYPKNIAPCTSSLLTHLIVIHFVPLCQMLLFFLVIHTPIFFSWMTVHTWTGCHDGLSRLRLSMVQGFAWFGRQHGDGWSSSICIYNFG